MSTVTADNEKEKSNVETEREIEALLVRLVKQAGGAALKFVSPGHSGVPDRIVLLPGGDVWFVELKTRTGRLSYIQRYWQGYLRLLGCNCTVLRSKAEVTMFVRSLTAGGDTV